MALSSDPATPPPPLLGPGSRFEGMVAFRGAVRLDGRVDGRVVASGCLWVGESAEIHARIEVDDLIVAGSIEGEIHAVGRVELLPSARVHGVIRTPRLAVAEGARFEGRLEMASG